MRLVGGNLLKTLLLILMIIAYSYSLLRISYVPMSPYRGGMDRVVIGSIWVCRYMWMWKGIHRIGRRSRILHVGGQGV